MFALTGQFARVLFGMGLGRALGPGRTVVTSAGVRGRAYRLSGITDSRFAGVIRGLIAAAGVANIVDFFIPDSILDTVNLDDIGGGIERLFGGGTRPSNPPSTVVREWHNGIGGDASKATAFFVMLEDGRQGARRKDGTWRYYRAKKPVGVTYSNGVAGDLRDFERTAKVVLKQAKDLKKVVNQLVPSPKQSRRRSAPAITDAPLIVKEDGKGDLVVARR